MLLAGAVAYVIVVILTVAYFVGEVMYFSNLPVDAPLSEELLRRVELWYKTAVIRNIIQAVALVFFVIATIKRLKY